jgi:uncharacterized protein (DUF885 family)
MPADESHTRSQATALYHLIDREWEFRMREDPLLATDCGDHRFDHLLPSVSVEDEERRMRCLREFLDELHAIDAQSLVPEDSLNYALLERDLADRVADAEFGAHLMPISKQNGFHLYFPDLPAYMPLGTVADCEAYIARLEGFEAYAKGHIELMRAGIAQGLTQPRIALEGIEGSIQSHIVTDAAESVLYQPIADLHPGIGDPDRRRIQEAAARAILTSVVPGYQALLAFMTGEYLPAAREEIGASTLPNGPAYYAHCVRKYTTLEITPEQVHEIGLDEVRRIRGEMATLIEKVRARDEGVPAGDHHAFLEFLHSNPAFYVTTPEALLQHVALILKRIDGQLPRLFSLLPRLPYGIRETPDYAAPDSTTAYYFPGAGDGTRAGYYYVNTYGLDSRPLYEYEALSLHEAVPGHHLQLALQMELDLPNFRRFGGVTAFIEGWALYAERLGLEMGFFQDPYSDFGRLIFEIWRAARLVVDTGIHQLGWTRQQAIDYMAENTALTRLNIANEVDRYIAWPGQALAYKMGELAIRDLRRTAEARMASRFDLRQFHRSLLEAGGMPLDLLERRVLQWIESILETPKA